MGNMARLLGRTDTRALMLHALVLERARQESILRNLRCFPRRPRRPHPGVPIARGPRAMHIARPCSFAVGVRAQCVALSLQGVARVRPAGGCALPRRRTHVAHTAAAAAGRTSPRGATSSWCGGSGCGVSREEEHGVPRACFCHVCPLLLVCVCVCVCVCVFVCVCVMLYVCMCARTHTHTLASFCAQHKKKFKKRYQGCQAGGCPAEVLGALLLAFVGHEVWQQSMH